MGYTYKDAFEHRLSATIFFEFVEENWSGSIYYGVSNNLVCRSMGRYNKECDQIQARNALACDLFSMKGFDSNKLKGTILRKAPKAGVTVHLSLDQLELLLRAKSQDLVCTQVERICGCVTFSIAQIKFFCEGFVPGSTGQLIKLWAIQFTKLIVQF